MSVSTETETSENAQQNEEQEAAAQAEEQEVVEQVAEPPVPNNASNNQESKFDFEKSKGKLEYISIVLALTSVISTGIVKVLSAGSHLHFSFDINNYEFKLTNNDLIIFFLSIFFCFFAIVFCRITNSARSKIFVKINNCLKSKTNIKKILGTILWVVAYGILLFYYLFLGSFIIELLCSQKDVALFKYVLRNTYSVSFLLVLSFYLFPIVEKKVTKIILAVLGMFTFLMVSLAIINYNYEKAVNQREFEIIVSENNEGHSQEYVVISKGSSYSAYQCSIEDQEAGKVLIIHTDRHRFFPLDDTDTRLNVFDEYHLYKYGKPLKTSDEENNPNQHQSNA